jgi:hypothetical protein
MVYESLKLALGLQTWDVGKSWSRLGPNLLWGHEDLTPFILGVLVDLQRSFYLITGKFDFTPCGKRHVHRNHMVRAVHLIRVDG